MATDYNKALLDKWYTQAEIDQMKSAVNSWQSAKDVVANMNAQKASNNANTTSSNKSSTSSTNSTPTTYTTKSEYGGQGSNTSAQPKDTSWDTGNWTYTYNPKSWYYESKPQTHTGWTSTGGSSTTPDYTSSIRSTWDKLTPEKQQELLKNNPDLKNNLARYWLTPKTVETPKEETTWADEWTTKWGWEWDYQDNSPERMKQIADNVNQMYLTDPWLFADENTFRNFFIDWKWRTPEQEKFLMDFYKNRKMYNKLDTYTSSEIWNKYVNGEIPDSYLTYLKNSDPQRYAEVMDAKANAEWDIKDSAYYDTISNMTWEWDDNIASKVIEWLKAQWLLVDEDWNLIDDRREHYASDEEKWYQKEIADINARNLEIDNIVKHSYDDLVERYPWASKATLMAMAQDRNADLLREKENNLVQLTRLQGYVSYMQEERFEMNKAWAETISQLEKDYWMYYQYSPQWMSELAQMQYAATNVTLDQADNWTYTQKQMALENVLAPIYEQYWSIIERPMAKAINDIIAYAQNKWVSLSQAFEDNFMKYLKAKPQYSQLSSPEPYTIKVGDVAYQYDFETWEFTPINTSVIWTATGLWTMRTERNNNPTAMITAYAKQLWGVEWVDYVQWDSFTSTDENWVTHTYYTAKLIGDPMDKTIELIDRWVANNAKQNVFSAWSYAKDLWMTNEKWKNMSREEKEALILKMLQHEWWDITKMAYYNQWENAAASNQNSKFGNLAWWNNDWYLDTFAKDYEAYLKSPKDYDKSDIEARYAPLWMSWYDFTAQATNYAKTWMKQSAIWDAAKSLESAVALYEYINWNQSWSWWKNRAKWLTSLYGWNLLGGLNSIWGNAQDSWFDMVMGYLPKTRQYDAKTYFKSLDARQTLDKLIETKQQWATYWAMSEWEWEMLRSAANLLDWGQTWEEFQKNLEDLIYSLQLAIKEWGWQLPQNYYWSSASNMVIQESSNWRWDRYKYSGNWWSGSWWAPSEI